MQQHVPVTEHQSPAQPATKDPLTLLDEVNEPVASAEVSLLSGRRYELEAGARADRVVVRSSKGEVILRIEVTDAGPVLSFSGAEVELVATRRLSLAGQEVSVHAAGDIAINAGGSLYERVEADHHTRVGGCERLEASQIEMQANEAGLVIKTMGAINLDGEHIGLNDDPVPRPFVWSAIGSEG